MAEEKAVLEGGEPEPESEPEKEKRSKERNKKHDKRKLRGLASVSKQRVKDIATSGGLAPHSLRGLQGASVETRHRVSTLAGKIRAKNIEGMRSAGKRGGEVVRELYGVEYYQNLGAKGGGATLEKYSITYFSNLAQKSKAARKKKKQKKERKKKSKDNKKTYSLDQATITI